MTIALYIIGGTIYWVLNNKSHNNYGPAVIRRDNSKLWHNNGLLHRLDGPAIICSTGTKQWYINDIEYKTHLEYLVALEEYNLSKETV